MGAELVVPGFVACAGAWITYDQGRAAWQGLRSAGWPRVRGLVRRVDIIGSSVPLVRNRSALGAMPVVEYEYRVAGQKYTSSRVNWTGFGKHAAAERYLAYQKLKHVQVCYDPRAPGTAVLEPGAPASAWVRVAIGIGILIVGVLMVISAL